MTDDARHDSGEEELAAGTATPTGRVLLVAVALIAAVAVPLVIVVDHSRPGPPGAGSASSRSPRGGLTAANAADALLPGSPTSNRLGPRLVYTAELTNATDAELTVEYPIRLSGAGSGPETASYVDLTPTGELVNFDTPSVRVTHIAAHAHTTLELGLHLRCQSSPWQPAWPTGNSRIAITLAGYPTPAVFSFAGLFGFDIRADLRNACPRTA